MKACLANLPSRGHLVSVHSGSVFAANPTLYIACHDTDPPPGQVIKTDPTSILLRAIRAQKAKEQVSKKKQSSKPGTDKGKRKLEDQDQEKGSSRPGGKRSTADNDAGPSSNVATASRPTIVARKQPASRARPTEPADAGVSGAGGSSQPTRYSRLMLQAKTIRELQSILKELSLPVSGKKDDLILRILESQRSNDMDLT